MKKILLTLWLVLTATFQASAGGLVDSNKLFAWAEGKYPAYLSPSGPETVQTDDGFSRFYADTETYLSTSGENVYIFSPVLGDEVIELGVISDFVETVALTYDYNENEGSVRTLSAVSVNEYVSVQDRLFAQRDNDDARSFDNTFESYVNDLLNHSHAIGSAPSYAPRGILKSLTVEVANGEIDYSGFVLQGDINLDSEVNFEDLEALRLAIFSGSSDAAYNVNSDDSLDLRDVIFLLARIGTDVKYFDFYTIAGERVLSLPTRDVSDARVVGYTGPETQVMVVPKDMNKASGFESDLSAIEDLWYQKTGWVSEGDWSEEARLINEDVWYQKTGWVYEGGWSEEVGLSDEDEDLAYGKIQAISQDNFDIEGVGEADSVGRSKGKIIKNVFERLINFAKVKNAPHLVGWHVNVQYVDVGTYKALDTYGMDGSVSYIQPYEDRIRTPYFAKTTMMHDKRAITRIAYALHLGFEGPTVDLRAVRQPITATLFRAGERVTVRQIIHANSLTFTSKEEHTLSGDIWSTDIPHDGVINLHRVGPYPTEKDFPSVSVTDGNFEAPGLPYGAYDIEFESSCGCVTPLEKSFIFKDEETNIFEVEGTSKNVTVGLTIVTGEDDAEEPLKNVAVAIKSIECVSEEKNASGTTNDQGFVKFTDMPIGKYDVSVDGEVVDTITFCDNYNSTVTVSTDRLWKFKVVFNNPDYGRGTITATNIEIDFEAEADPSGTKIYAIAPSTCGGALFGCGELYILNDLFVNPGSTWVLFESNITIAPGFSMEMISAEMDYGMNGLVCDGHIPDGFNADSDVTTWTYSNGFSSWVLTLEPCDSSGCE